MVAAEADRIERLRRRRGWLVGELRATAQRALIVALHQPPSSADVEHGGGVEERMGTSVAGMSGHYRESAEMIASLKPGSAFLSALRVELERLEEEASRPSASS